MQLEIPFLEGAGLFTGHREYLNARKMASLDEFLRLLDVFFAEAPRTFPIAGIEKQTGERWDRIVAPKDKRAGCSTERPHGRATAAASVVVWQ